MPPPQAPAVDKGLVWLPGGEGTLLRRELAEACALLGLRAEPIADETELPFPDNSIDRVLLVHALESSEHPSDMLGEVWRVLGGGEKGLGKDKAEKAKKYVGPYKIEPVNKANIDPAKYEFDGEVKKSDAEKRQVFGWCSLSKVDGVDVVDRQGDYVPIDEMEKSAYHYVVNSRKGGDMHQRVGDQPLHTSDLIESFVVTPEKLEAMGLEPDAVPHGWWVGFKVNDEQQWENVKKGDRVHFSIHGKGRREPRASL